MSSEVLHVPREKLSRKTLDLHYAITSLMEEFEAVDWYRQRADDIEDPELKAIVLHNAREELEHASMVLEWIRTNFNAGWASECDVTFANKPISSSRGPPWSSRSSTLQLT